MIFLIFISINLFSKDLSHLQAFLACENKIESFKKDNCKYQTISVARAKRISDDEFFKVNCGKSQLKGFVTTSNCVPKVTTVVPRVSKLQILNQASSHKSNSKATTRSSMMSEVSGKSLIKVNSSLKELLKTPRVKIGH